MRPDDFEDETELMVNCMAYPDHEMCAGFKRGLGMVDCTAYPDHSMCRNFKRGLGMVDCTAYPDHRMCRNFKREESEFLL